MVVKLELVACIAIASLQGISEIHSAETLPSYALLQENINKFIFRFCIQAYPEFDRTKPQNVTALVGKTAFLTCGVYNLKPNQKVSWVRHRDVHILTAGEKSFTTDQRFSAKHNTDDEWVLVIKYVQERDAGIYECQIPTQPPQSYQINLNVIVPHVRIQGQETLYVVKNSMINLTCLISHSPEPPAYIFWYHNDEVIAYDSPRGGITVITENGKDTQSHLIIKNAEESDSGNYTCKPSIFKTATVRLHVLNDKEPDELKTSSGFKLLTDQLIISIMLFIHSSLCSYSQYLA